MSIPRPLRGALVGSIRGAAFLTASGADDPVALGVGGRLRLRLRTAGGRA